MFENSVALQSGLMSVYTIKLAHQGSFIM